MSETELPLAGKAAAEKAVQSAVKETQEKGEIEDGEIEQDDSESKPVTVFNDQEHFVSFSLSMWMRT